MKVLLELYALSASGSRGVTVEEYLSEVEKATATEATVIADNSCAFVAEKVQYAITNLIELKVVDLKKEGLVLTKGWASMFNILDVLSKTSRITRFPIVLWDVKRPSVISQCFFVPSENYGQRVDQTHFLRCFDKSAVHIRFEVNHYELSRVTASIDNSHFTDFFTSILSLTSFTGKLLTNFLLYCISFITTIDAIRFCQKTKN